MNSTQLTKHFSLDEVIVSQEAERRGIANTPTPEHLANLRCTARNMEAVRKLLGDNPIFVTSGYRSEIVNRLIGGSLTSAHMTGYAIDFVCRGFGTPYEVCRQIQASDIKYDQLIHEFGRWVHISFDPKNRQQDLTILKQNGRTVALKGIKHV